MAGRKPKGLPEGKAPGKDIAQAKALGPAPMRTNPKYVEVVNRPEGGVRYDLRPAAYPYIEERARSAHELSSIAKALGISLTTFNELRKRDPAVTEALRRGQGELSDELADILLTHARDGNVIAAIYTSKARAGWRENDSAVAPTVNVQINLPAAADPSAILTQLPPIEDDE